MISVTLPLRLVSVANQREHWSKKAKRAKAHRSAAVLMLAPRVAAYAKLARFVVTLTRIAPRALDGDNLQSAFKACRDGVADALGTSDNDPRILWDYRQERGKPKYYAVTITIEASA